MITTVAIGGDVQRLVGVQKLEHIRRRRGVDDRGGDELIHGLVIRGFGGVMHKTGAAAVDCTGEECHADGFLM